MIINPWSLIDKPASDFNVRLVDADHPLRLFWGVDAKNQYLFLYEGDPDSMPSAKSLPNLSGISSVAIPGKQKSRLVLLLNDSVNWELFHALCTDLIRATERIQNPGHGPSIVLRRLQRWQEFLKKERSGLLPLEKIKGLVGELLFLKGPLAENFGWESAVLFWQGPEDAPQDFAVHDCAVEIKCQSGGSKPSVRITSVDQLNPQLSKGYLVVYTLATASDDAEGCFNLNDLVAQIKEALSSGGEQTRERFEDLIYQTGYIPSEKYEEYKFTKIAVQSFVLSPGFPRIKQSSVPEAISSVSYALHLDACKPFAEKPEWWSE